MRADSGATMMMTGIKPRASLFLTKWHISGHAILAVCSLSIPNLYSGLVKFYQFMREFDNGVAQFWRSNDDSLWTQADDKHTRHINRLDAETCRQPAIFAGRLNNFGA